MSLLTDRLLSITRAFSESRLRPPILPFRGYAPDRAAFGNPGVLDAENVMPTPDGFRPLKALSVESDALTARCRGATAAADVDGNVYVYAGDATKLYRLVNETFEDASKSGGYSGTTFFETRGTTFLMLTWFSYDPYYDLYLPVWNDLLSTYDVP